jgi:hypothetical protein
VEVSVAKAEAFRQSCILQHTSRCRIGMSLSASPPKDLGSESIPPSSAPGKNCPSAPIHHFSLSAFQLFSVCLPKSSLFKPNQGIFHDSTRQNPSICVNPRDLRANALSYFSFQLSQLLLWNRA